MQCTPSRALVLGLALSLAPLCVASAQTVVTVDATATHQTMVGFGATTISLAFAGTNDVPAALRTRAIEALYRDVRLNMGNLEIEPCEAPPSNVYAPANDDGDPTTINAAGFNWIQSQNMHDLVVAPGTPFGFTDWFIGPVVTTGYALAWVNALRTSDYNAYLAEIAEHAVAVASHWRDTYGASPSLLMLFNEPTSGNGELVGGDATTIVDIVKRAGAALRAAGFADVRFVVPCEEREDISLDHARRILEDPVARPFVGAIGYHPYPYGSTYAAVPNILATSGAGTPDATKVALRNQLRDLGATYGVPLFMMEVSHSELPFDDFGNVRGRAIHIHDELVYADASAFFGMNAMWDTVTHAAHFMGRTDPGFWNETDTIVLIDVGAGNVVISPMGRAIGHYARWLRRGAVRVDATTGDPLVLATAFVDASTGRLVVVAINDATSDRTLDVSVSGVTLAGAVEGELSTATAPWVTVTGVTAASGHIAYTLPSHGVVSLSASLATTGPTDGGASDAAPGTDAGGGDGSVVIDGGSAMDGGPRADGGGTVSSGGCGCSAVGASRDGLAWAGFAACVALVVGRRATRLRTYRRDREPKRRALADGPLGPHTPAVPGDHSADGCEADAGTLEVGGGV